MRKSKLNGCLKIRKPLRYYMNGKRSDEMAGASRFPRAPLQV